MDQNNGNVLNKENMLEFLHLPPEINKGQCKASLYAGQKVVIENHCGLVECFEDRVVIKNSEGWMIIKGDNLRIQKIDDYAIVITGKVKTLENAY